MNAGVAMPLEPSKRLLVIMAKEPVPGQVKTRLQTHLTPRTTADLYRCFLLDRFEEMCALSGLDRAVAFAPETAGDYFTSLAPEPYFLIPQQGKDLSERLTTLFFSMFANGYKEIVVTDSDSPDLPKTEILKAFTLLTEGSEVVFGPCRDGGYYLVGMRRHLPALFEGVPWSTSRVLEESLARASDRGLRCSLLSLRQDIDTFDDLKDFFRRRRGGIPGQVTPGGRTFAFLTGLAESGALSLE